MRVTVCELPHEPAALSGAWDALVEHTAEHDSQLVVLPEFAMVDPVWESEEFDQERWADIEALSDAWLRCLPELSVAHVVGARPVTVGAQRFNEGFLWSSEGGVMPLRRKYFLPDEPGGWEARWFDRGDAGFPCFHAGALSFGLNICSEMWALETYAAYSELDVQAVLSPRATGSATTGKWLAAGIVAAVRSGAFSLSSNRVDRSGTYGGVGWIVGPDGEVLARTSRERPFATHDIDLAVPERARLEYPRYVFGKGNRVAMW